MQSHKLSKNKLVVNHYSNHISVMIMSNKSKATVGMAHPEGWWDFVGRHRGIVEEDWVARREKLINLSSLHIHIHTTEKMNANFLRHLFNIPGDLSAIIMHCHNCFN